MRELTPERVLSRLVLGAALASLPACLTVPGAKLATPEEPLGSFVVAGPTFGERQLRPDGCSTGELQQFFGADFVDGRQGLVVRLALDPLTGPGVRVFAAEKPFEKALVFRQQDCRVFHFSLRDTGWKINDVRRLDTSLEVECATPAGDTLSGSARDGSCL